MKKLKGCLFTVKFSEGLRNLYVCENVRGSHVCSPWVSLIYYIRSSLLKTALLEIESRGEHSLSFLDLAVVGLLPNSYSLLCYCHPRQVCQYEGLVNSWEPQCFLWLVCGLMCGRYVYFECTHSSCVFFPVTSRELSMGCSTSLVTIYNPCLDLLGIIIIAF